MTSENPQDDTYECRKCGSTHEFAGDRVVCYGTGVDPHKGDPVEVVRPCGNCGDPITTGEICSDCAEKIDGDAFTTNWGTRA